MEEVGKSFYFLCLRQGVIDFSLSIKNIDILTKFFAFKGRPYTLLKSIYILGEGAAGGSLELQLVFRFMPFLNSLMLQLCLEGQSVKRTDECQGNIFSSCQVQTKF